MEQMNIFDFVRGTGKPIPLPIKIDKPIRLIELFAGIGSQAKALKRLGADFEHYRVCEFDKYAIKSYNAIHGTSFEASDVTQITAEDLGIVNTDKYCYILTYSFPCQDLSLAGKGNGMAKGSGTRSGLLWEVERLLSECSELPQILLMENVTQVHGKKNKEHFDEWIRFLKSKGYSNYWKDLNAKNFGIPQNRNRTFMVSVLGDYVYEFPQEFPLELRLKDMLEDSVDEKFYLSGKMIDYLHTITEKNKARNNNNVYSPTDVDGISKCVTTKEGSRVKDNFIEETCIQVGVLSGGKWDKLHDISRRVYSGDGVAPTIHTCGGGNTEPKVVAGIGEKNFGKQYRQGNRIYDANEIAMALTSSPVGNAGGFSYLYAVDDPFICASRGRNPENPSDRTPGTPTEQRLEPNFSGCSNTLTTVQKDNYVVEPQINVVGNYSPSGHDASRIVDADELAPTVKENHGTVTGVVEPLAYDEQNKYIRTDGTVGTLTTDGSSPKHNNRVIEPMVWDGYNQRIRAESGTVGTLTTNCGADLKRNAQGIIELQSQLRIRKLTPKECWRLMGFDDADFEKAEAVNSNSQLYKQAGNSIVVDVLYYIFGKMRSD